MNEMSEQIGELAAALAKAQAALKPAAKDSVNPHFRSRYADLSSVWEACRGALAANGLSIVQMPTAFEPGYAGLRTVLLHSSGQYISSLVGARLTKDDAQGMGSAITYLRRYALAAMVGVVADEDDDGNAAVDRPPPAQHRSTTRGEGAPPRPPADKPALTPEDAERRFYARYGDAIGGKTWGAVQRYLGHLLPRPSGVEEWIAAGESVRDKQRATEAA